eukprot:7381038-Prymnesium_polylepis.2
MHLARRAAQARQSEAWRNNATTHEPGIERESALTDTVSPIRAGGAERAANLSIHSYEIRLHTN